VITASRTGAGWYSFVEFRQQKPGTEGNSLLNNRYTGTTGKAGSVEKTGDTAAIEKNQEALAE